MEYNEDTVSYGVDDTEHSENIIDCGTNDTECEEKDAERSRIKWSSRLSEVPSESRKMEQSSFLMSFAL